MTAPEDPDRFRRLPEPVPREELVETLDTASHEVPDGSEERDRLLREAGGA